MSHYFYSLCTISTEVLHYKPLSGREGAGEVGLLVDGKGPAGNIDRKYLYRRVRYPWCYDLVGF